MINLGDVATGSTIQVPWSSNGADGASITRATDGSIRIYKDNSTTQRSSSAGITDNEDFDSITGVHLVNIDLSDNTDAGFYAAGHNYHVMLVAATIDGKTVNSWLATFSIQNRYSSPSGTFTANVTQWNGTNVATPDVAGYPKVTIKSGTGTGEVSISSGLVRLSPTGVDDIWDEATSGHSTAGTTGKALTDAGGAGTPPSAAAIADAVWDEARSGHVASGSFGESVVLSASERDAAADALLNRATSSITESAAPKKSLYAAIAKLTHKTDSAAGTLTVMRSDDSTPHFTQAETTDAAADPLTGLGGAA
jgi:hypothetical protein